MSLLSAEALWNIVLGKAPPLSIENLEIGIGDGDAPNDGQTTGLKGAQQAYMPVESIGGPEDGKIMLRATFGRADANFAWQESVVRNKVTGEVIDRTVKFQGLKVAGTVWGATIELGLTDGPE